MALKDYIKNVLYAAKIKKEKEEKISPPLESIVGSSPLESLTVGSTGMVDTTTGMNDRSLNLKITRDDAGCEWAYENDEAVFNSISRLDGIVNNGFDVIITPLYKKEGENTQAIEAQKYMKKKIKELKLRDITSSEIKNRALFGFSVTKIINSGNGEEVAILVPIYPKECKPIRDIMTGKLGGLDSIGKDGTRPNEEIAIIQQGNKVIYDATGNQNTSGTVYYYMTPSEVITINDNDRGKFKGVSRVLRVLRYVEMKKNLENAVELISRRFGPQVWVTVGNADYNLTKADLPKSYLTNSSTGNPVDPATARAQFKSDKMNDILGNIRNMVNGDGLVNIAEFGIDAKTFNPSAGGLDYQKYIELMADFIKIGVLGMDIPGRIDVTSGIMQDKLTRDIKDAAMRDREMIEDIWNERIIKPCLRANGYPDDMVEVKFKELDKSDDERVAIIQQNISDAVYNYSKAGWIDLPEQFKEKFDFSTEEVKAKLDPLKFVPEIKDINDTDEKNPQSAPKTPPSNVTQGKNTSDVEKMRQKDLNQGR